MEVLEASQILLLCHPACSRDGTQIYPCNSLLIRKFRGDTRRQVVGYSDIIFSEMITVAATTSNNYN